MEIKKDILGKTPKVGDTITFNPPLYKGLIVGKCCGFTNAGNVKFHFDNFESLDYNQNNPRITNEIKKRGFYSIKTNFAIL